MLKLQRTGIKTQKNPIKSQLDFIMNNLNATNQNK